MLNREGNPVGMAPIGHAPPVWVVAFKVSASPPVIQVRWMSLDRSVNNPLLWLNACLRTTEPRPENLST